MPYKLILTTTIEADDRDSMRRKYQQMAKTMISDTNPAPPEFETALDAEPYTLKETDVHFGLAVTTLEVKTL